MTGVRRQLASLVAVTTSLILLAFLIPLGMVLRDAAADRAIAKANDTAQSTAAVILVDPSADGVDDNLDDGLSVTVFFADGTIAGAPATRTPSVELASDGQAFTATSGSGVEALVPVQGMPGGTAVVRAYASRSLLRRNVTRTWFVLIGLGLALFALGLLLADRLGRRLVGSVTALAATADRLAGGDLDARVTPSGPRELRSVGSEINRLATRIGELLTAEREEVADLAHRLRTPVTALRLDVDTLTETDARSRLDTDLDHLSRVVDEVIRTARRPVREGAGASADLAAVAAARVAFWAPLADDDGRPLELTVPATEVPVRCSTDDLAAALDALLQNVFAHTPDGAGMTVDVESRPGGGGRLVVTDAGLGFAARAAERGVSTGESTGLGLDIARRTAEAGGGEMTVDAAPSGGARITLTFDAPA